MPFGRLAVVCLIAIVSFSSLAAAPAVTFDGEAVAVGGVAPGGEVVLVGVAHEPHGYTNRISTYAHVLPAADGSVRHELARTVSLQSVWIAVDIANGLATIASPRAEPPVITQERLSIGELRQLARANRHLTFILVRPRSGAWGLSVEDSGIYDADGVADQQVKVDVERMQPIGDSPSAPRSLAAGDVVFAIDPATLTVTELRGE